MQLGLVSYLVGIGAVPADGAAAAVRHTGSHGRPRAVVHRIQCRSKASLAARSLRKLQLD